MRVLWVSNSPIGPAAELLGEEYKGSSGGWIQSEYDFMAKEDKSFFFLTSLGTVKENEIVHKKGDKGELFCVNAPRLSYGISVPKKTQKLIQDIIDTISPDVIQIWGTETWLSSAVAKSKTNAPKVIFIQGLLGVHQRYLGGYFGENRDDKKYIKKTGAIAKIKKVIRSYYFKKQAAIERETIDSCRNVIVDSDFAKAYCTSISENVRCFHHALLPNAVFKMKKWNLSDCNRHTVFTIYGSSAEKGTQNLLKAVAIVKRKYPDIKVLIPGNYLLDQNNKLKKKSKDYFQNVLYNMIENLNLVDNIVFTGRLSVTQMADELQQCHVFVNSSCMEVHALSLREALTVGVPSVSSLCGSTGEYIKHGENGLIYRYEEYETLAYYISRIFEDDKFAMQISEKALIAMRSISNGTKSLNEIYDGVMGESIGR